MTSITDAIRHHIAGGILLSGPGRVVPIVVVRTPGCGVVHATREVAGEMGLEMIDVRCANMHPSDFERLPTLKGGDVVLAEPSMAWLRGKLATDRTTILLLDEAVAGGVEVASSVLAQASRDARGRVIAILTVLPSEKDHAMRAIAEGLGVLETQVGSCAVSADDMLADFLEHARASGLDPTIIAFLEENGLSGGTLRGWVRLGSVVDPVRTGKLDANTAGVLAEGYLGREAKTAFFDWCERRAAKA